MELESTYPELNAATTGVARKRITLSPNVRKFCWFILAFIVPYFLLDASKENHNQYYLITGLFIFLVGEVIYTFGQSVNLLNIAALLAVIQWIVGPMVTYYIDYQFFASDEIMLFKVSEAEYFGYTIPGTIAFVLGIRLLNPGMKHYKHFPEYVKRNQSRAAVVGKLLFYVGIFFTVSESFIPPILGYVGWLMKGLLQVSVIVYWLFDLPRKYFVTALGVGLIAINAVLGGMFGELVYWLLFISILVSMRMKISLFKKLLFFSASFIAVFIISATKWQYRIITWNAEVGEYSGVDKLVLYKDIIVNNVTNNDIDRVRAGQEVIVRRLNQGGTISHIMNRVPKTEPYANGETIFSAIATAIVPRVLWPNKPVAGKKDFYRFTGYRLKGTSMGITPIGEAYANYGRTGGIITMFFYGLFMALLFRIIIKRSLYRDSLLIIFIPLIFFRAIYAESDLMRTLTAATKGVMFVVFINFVLKQYLKRTSIE